MAGWADYPPRIHAKALQPDKVFAVRVRLDYTAKYVEQTPNEDGKKDFFSMELNDKSPMPQGKFKGQPMENVPY